MTCQLGRLADTNPSNKLCKYWKCINLLEFSEKHCGDSFYFFISILY